MAATPIIINFGDNLRNDPDAKFWVFFSSLPNPSNNYGRTNAVLVQDFDLVEMTGLVNGLANKIYIFDYDSNSQGGRIPGSPVNITVVGIGLATSQYVKATATLDGTPLTSVSLVSLIEKNYDNSTA
jgi:hypothetical protein